MQAPHEPQSTHRHAMCLPIEEAFGMLDALRCGEHTALRRSQEHYLRRAWRRPHGLNLLQQNHLMDWPVHIQKPFLRFLLCDWLS